MTNGMRGKQIALIGGAGLIGHNLALSVAALGAKVDVVDSLQVNNLLSFSAGGAAGPKDRRDLYVRMIRERLELLEKAQVPLHIQDARDYHALSRVLSDIKPNVIVH